MTNANTLSGLFNFISKSDWASELSEILNELVADACEDANVDVLALPEIIGPRHCDNLWGCALEELMATEFEDGSNVVDEYLKKRGPMETSAAKRYMMALRHASLSLYEVSDVVPGQSFMARDLIRGGDPVRIAEVRGSQSLKAWDRIAVRVVQLGSDYQMTGGILVFSREASNEILDTFKKINDIKVPYSGEKAKKISEVMAPLLVHIWLADTLDHVLNQRPPDLRNGDGDDFVACTSTFEFRPGTKPAAIKKVLSKIKGLEKGSDRIFAWLETGVTAPEVMPTIGGATTISAFSSGVETLLGNIEVFKSEVMLSTNSRKRAERGEALLTAALGAYVNAPTREEITSDALFDEAGQNQSARPRGSEGGFPPEQEELAREVIHSLLDQHYRKTLDDTVPALGGLTPRQAAKSAKSRKLVVDWLKGLENGTARTRPTDDPIATYDFAWMWAELGLEKLRA